MSESQIRISKWIIAATWVVLVLSFFFPASPARTWGVLLFRVLLTAHTIEAVLFLRLLRSTGNPLGGEIVQTILFGFVHILEIRNRRPTAGR